VFVWPVLATIDYTDTHTHTHTNTHTHTHTQHIQHTHPVLPAAQVLTNRIKSMEAVLSAARLEMKQKGEEIEIARQAAAGEAESRGAMEEHVAALMDRVRVAGAAAEASEAAAKDDVAVERRGRAAAEHDAAMVIEWAIARWNCHLNLQYLYHALHHCHLLHPVPHLNFEFVYSYTFRGK
jgi:hypothetical protein